MTNQIDKHDVLALHLAGNELNTAIDEYLNEVGGKPFRITPNWEADPEEIRRAEAWFRARGYRNFALTFSMTSKCLTMRPAIDDHAESAGVELGED